MNERTGFIGLGNMGSPMARNLLRHRGDLIVHDKLPNAAEGLIDDGASWASDLPMLAAQVDTIVTSLPGPRQIEEVAFGTAGLFSNLRPGSLWVDTSTNDPSLARRLASEAAAKGHAFVDAPVTGGVIGAREASLTIMAGGDDGHVERARPTLSCISSKVIHTGPSGTGCAMKLIVNFLGITHTALAAEALSLGRVNGLPPNIMLSVLEGCWGHNAMLNDIVETAERERHWGFGLDLAKKDLALAADLARSCGLSSRYSEVTHELLASCTGPTPADDDLWRVVEACESQAGVTIA